MKRCTKCGGDKPLDDFGKTKPGKGCANDRRARCKTCERSLGRDHYQRNLEAQRERSRKRVRTPEGRLAVWRSTALKKYGLTPDQIERMKAERGYRCDVCGLVFAGRHNQSLHVDHCHKSGRVRGMLCQGCNCGIGHLGDSPERLHAAIEYLWRANAGTVAD